MFIYIETYKFISMYMYVYTIKWCHVKWTILSWLHINHTFLIVHTILEHSTAGEPRSWLTRGTIYVYVYLYIYINKHVHICHTLPY
jgi:hypothetical protein